MNNMCGIIELSDADLMNVEGAWGWGGFGASVGGGAICGALGGAMVGGVGAVPGAIGGALLGGMGYCASQIGDGIDNSGRDSGSNHDAFGGNGGGSGGRSPQHNYNGD